MNKKPGNIGIRRLIEMALASLIISGLGLIAVPMYVYATGTTNTVTATVTVPTVCVPVISNTAITFNVLGGGPNVPGANAPTSNAILVNNVGTANSNIWVQGTSWTYLSNTFNVGNTAWNPTNIPDHIAGNQLTASATDTKVFIPDNVLGTGSNIGNNIFFGANIPSNVLPGAYTQTITISSSC